MREAALDYLLHGSVVILIGQPLQLEVLIITLARLAALKYHHAGNNIRSGNVGNVKGFHAVWGRDRKHFSQGDQGGVETLLFVRQPLGFLQGIFVCQLDESHIIPLLRDPDLAAAAVLLLHELGKQLAVLNFEGQQNDFGGQTPAEIILLHQAGNCFLRVFRYREYIVVLIQQISSAEVQHGKASLDLGLPVADHIRIRQGTGGDQLLLPQGFYGIQPVPQGRGHFKFQVVRCCKHGGFDFIGNGFVIAL